MACERFARQRIYPMVGIMVDSRPVSRMAQKIDQLCERQDISKNSLSHREQCLPRDMMVVGVLECEHRSGQGFGITAFEAVTIDAQPPAPVSLRIQPHARLCLLLWALKGSLHRVTSLTPVEIGLMLPYSSLTLGAHRQLTPRM